MLVLVFSTKKNSYQNFKVVKESIGREIKLFIFKKNTHVIIQLVIIFPQRERSLLFVKFTFVLEDILFLSCESSYFGEEVW